MRVVEVIDKPSLSEPQVWCKWYESATRETRINVFREGDLQPFDWE
jgi:hypothetical protein